MLPGEGASPCWPHTHSGSGKGPFARPHITRMLHFSTVKTPWGFLCTRNPPVCFSRFPGSNGGRPDGGEEPLREGGGCLGLRGLC